jgi:NodT family efflux transporter outer membrane factor (OMF) lipoprotein
MNLISKKRHSIITKTNRFILVALSSICLILFLQGCKSVGPDYVAPITELPDAWEQNIVTKLTKEPTTDLENWWQVFNDTTLNLLISKAKENNKNLKISYSRILEARANAYGVSGEKSPFVATGVEVSESQESDNGNLAQLAPVGGFKPQSLFSIGGSASWELDVFGRVRRSVEAVDFEYQATVDDYYDMMVILLADVAINYVEFRSYQQLIINAQLNAEAQQESYEIAKKRYRIGLTSYLDVLQSKANLSETLASIPEFELQKFLSKNRLAVLLGVTNNDINFNFLNEGSIPKPTLALNVGLPTDLLRQRPDIRAAEKMIAKNNAKVGVATADLYPIFSLSGMLGFNSTSITNLFTGSSLNWSASLPISWQIFNRKRIKANISISEQRTQQALLNYENTVLEAYAEVENSIVSYNTQNKRYQYLFEAVTASKEAVNLVLVQYNTGITDFQNVLDTERSLFRQQNNLIESEAQIVVDLILLYKALGGGWEIPEATILNEVKE